LIILNSDVLPFRQGLQGRLCPQVVTCGYEGYCLSGKGSLIVEGKRHIVFQNVSGLKSRIFITAEFILRHESAALTLPERQNIYSPRRRKDAKLDVRFSPASIFICVTAVVLPFRQQW
jgi:hypothetical protein